MPADTVRFFARIRSLDLECPRCAAVFVCTERSRHPYDRKTGIFKCTRCSLTLAIGVIAYRASLGDRHVRPGSDQVPTPEQALALRGALAGGHLAPPTLRRPWSDPRNVVVAAECLCDLHGRGLVVHPSCPVHSATRAALPDRPNPKT